VSAAASIPLTVSDRERHAAAPTSAAKMKPKMSCETEKFKIKSSFLQSFKI
jgi:hypothetical protein